MFRSLLLLALCLFGLSLMVKSASAQSVSDKAKNLHTSSIVIDTHDDTTQRLLDPSFDIGTRHADGNIDVPRMREGGLDAIFFSIYISGKITGPKPSNTPSIRSMPSARQSASIPTISSSPLPLTKSAPPKSKTKSPR